MLKLVSMVPLLAAVIAVLSFAGTITLFYYGHPFWAIIPSFITTVTGAIAYIGFRAQRKVEAVTDTVVQTVGKQAERVADAVVERVSNK